MIDDPTFCSKAELALELRRVEARLENYTGKLEARVEELEDKVARLLVYLESKFAEDVDLDGVISADEEIIEAKADNPLGMNWQDDSPPFEVEDV